MKQKISHTRSASLPVFNDESDILMVRRAHTLGRMSSKLRPSLSVSPEEANGTDVLLGVEYSWICFSLLEHSFSSFMFPSCAAVIIDIARCMSFWPS